MAFQKVEFEFPDPDKVSKEIDVEPAKDVTNITEPPPKLEISKNETEVEIEVVDDTPEADRNRKPSAPPKEVDDDELANYSEGVKKRIQHFSKGYHDERRKAEAALREKEEAIRYAQSVAEENKRLKEQHEKSQAALIEQAKARTVLNLESAKERYQKAYESGDSKALVEAQEALIAAKNQAERVAALKPPSLQEKPVPVQTQPIAQEAPKLDEKLSTWQSRNRWFGADEEMTAFALGLHQKLVREGVDPQSDDYYDRIDRRMRQVFPETFDDDDGNDASPPAEKPRRSNVVAPASRSTAPKKIVLTQSAIAIAKRLGLTPEQYARQVAEDMRKQNG